MILYALVILTLVPIAAFCWARKHATSMKFTTLGITWGLVAAPVSLGLYATYFIPFVGLYPGMLGLFSVMFHGNPGYVIAIELGAVKSHTVVDLSGHIILFAINGIVWAILYGAIGFVFDRFLPCKQSADV